MNGQKDWKLYCKSEMPDLPPKPDDIPATPWVTYKDRGWNNLGDWLGTGTVATGDRQYLPMEETKAFIHSLKLKNQKEWFRYCKGEIPELPPKPNDIPYAPDRSYRNKGWQSWGDWLGSGTIGPHDYQFRPFEQARAFARSLNLKSIAEWYLYCKGEIPDLPQKPADIPSNPHRTYKDTGWQGIRDWLGTGTIGPREHQWQPFKKARAFVHALDLKTGEEWKRYCKGEMPDKPPLPEDIRKKPYGYKDKGWQGMGDWLGTEKDD